MNILYHQFSAAKTSRFIHFSNLEHSPSEGKESFSWIEKRRKRKAKLDAEEQAIRDKWENHFHEGYPLSALVNEDIELYNFYAEKRPVKWVALGIRNKILRPIGEFFDTLGSV